MRKKSDSVVMEKMLAGSGYSDIAIRYFIEKSLAVKTFQKALNECTQQPNR
jgi:hypothetical protein